MQVRKAGFTLIIRLQVFLLLAIVQQSAFAADYSGNITEEYLRSQFTFEAGEKLKYSECKKKSYPTCTYIWGAESKKDATRAKLGLAPKGNKLQLIYAQARSKKDFERVLATYKDAEKVAGMGTEAVWSNKRKQLSLITDSKLIIHVNIDAKGIPDLKGKAIKIANHVLNKL